MIEVATTTKIQRASFAAKGAPLQVTGEPSNRILLFALTSLKKESTLLASLDYLFQEAWCHDILEGRAGWPSPLDG